MSAMGGLSIDMWMGAKNEQTTCMNEQASYVSTGMCALDDFKLQLTCFFSLAGSG